MLNPSKLFKLKAGWESFARNHPKFINFISALRFGYLEEGTVIEINVTTQEGKTISGNIGLTKEDKKLLMEMSDLINK